VFAEEWDLGEQWCRTFRLPFVFAMWTARAGFESPELVRALQEARNGGVQHLAEIAEHEAPAVKLSSEQCLRYLRDNLHFYLGEQEWRALAAFRGAAARLGLAPLLPEGTSFEAIRSQALDAGPARSGCEV
jgi:chorismate dehydratase